MATVWPASPDPWLVDYVVWRINSGTVETRPSSLPDTGATPYATEVLYWCIWRRKGRPEPRPASFPVAEAIPPLWPYEVLQKVNARAPIQIPTTPIHDWLLAWVIWRFQGSPLPRPSTVPKDVSVIAPYCWSVLGWVAWQRERFSNPEASRPPNLPATIPSWCWDVLKKTNQAVPLGPPPPPPPPPGPAKPASTWALPMPVMFTAWGWFSDSQYRDNDEALQRMRAAGVKTVALQVGQFAPTVPDRCRAFGFKVALWGSPQTGDGEAVTVARADGYIAQIETPDEYQRALESFQAGAGAGVSRSLITTLYGLNTYTRREPTTQYPEGQITTVEYESLRPFVTHAFIETYVQDGGAHFPISKMMWAANQRGIDHANPTPGLWRETSLGVYGGAGELDAWGRQCGAYLSEGMTPGNWTELGRLGT